MLNDVELIISHVKNNMHIEEIQEDEGEDMEGPDLGKTLLLPLVSVKWNHILLGGLVSRCQAAFSCILVFTFIVSHQASSFPQSCFCLPPGFLHLHKAMAHFIFIVLTRKQNCN